MKQYEILEAFKRDIDHTPLKAFWSYLGWGVHELAPLSTDPEEYVKTYVNAYLEELEIPGPNTFPACYDNLEALRFFKLAMDNVYLTCYTALLTMPSRETEFYFGDREITLQRIFKRGIIEMDCTFSPWMDGMIVLNKMIVLDIAKQYWKIFKAILETENG